MPSKPRSGGAFYFRRPNRRETSAKDLIAQIEGSSPADDHYDAKVKVLGEYVDHHVQEEEGEMFPKVRKAKLDTVGLGEQIAERKAQIMQKKVLA